jgi:hypothetical protein
MALAFGLLVNGFKLTRYIFTQIIYLSYANTTGILTLNLGLLFH